MMKASRYRLEVLATISKKLYPLLALAVIGAWPVGAFGAHPLITEDTGTQGVGNYQLELTYDSNHKQDPPNKNREQSFNAVFSAGVLENLDVIFTLPYENVSERSDSGKHQVEGLGDIEIGAKWRFYEDEALSLALRPALALPSGDEDKGLGSGHVVPSLYGVMTYAADPWALHLHLGYTRNFHDGNGERDHILHASVAAEYGIGDSLRLVWDASVESNADQSGGANVGSMVIGMIYSPIPDIDIDLGYRAGLTDAAPDHAWLAGLALRF